MPVRYLLALVLLLAVLGMAILGLANRQGDLRDRVRELERELRDARRPRAAAPPFVARRQDSEALRLLREENVRLHRQLEERMANEPRRPAPPDGVRHLVSSDVWIADEPDLALTDAQRPRVTELKAQRDLELGLFDLGGPAVDENREAFRREIVDRWDLAIKQELDPLQQAKYDARRRGEGRYRVSRRDGMLFWPDSNTLDERSFYTTVQYVW